MVVVFIDTKLLGEDIVERYEVAVLVLVLRAVDAEYCRKQILAVWQFIVLAA